MRQYEQIQLRAVDGGFVGGDGAFVRAERSFQRIQVLLGDDALFVEGFVALELGLGVSQLSFVSLQVGLGLLPMPLRKAGDRSGSAVRQP